MNRKMLFVNIIFLLAMAISIFSIKRFMDNCTTDLEVNNDHTPDAYMVNAYYLRTNDKGERDVVVFSPLVKHFKKEDSSHFQQPDIKIYKNNEEWHITSKSGTGIKGSNTLYLYDNVLVEQKPSKKRGGTLLSTNSLSIFPKQNLVSTKDFVTIQQPGLKITATGLRGNLDTGDIQLLSKTKGQYDPKQTH